MKNIYIFMVNLIVSFFIYFILSLFESSTSLCISVALIRLHETVHKNVKKILAFNERIKVQRNTLRKQCFLSGKA